MLNEHFKAFYKLEINKQMILEHMALNNKFEMIKKVLEDDFYSFDPNFIFDYIAKKLREKDKGAQINENDLGVLIKNIIINDLYNISLVKLLGWFIGSFQFYDTFRLFTLKNSCYDEARTKYNNFETNDDITDYIDLEENYNTTLINCLQNNLEDLAIGLINFKNELKDKIIIDEAVKNNSLKFLKYLWETTQQQRDDRINSRKSSRNSVGSRKSANRRSKSMLMVSKTISNFNNGELIFMPSELIKKFANSGQTNYNASLHEIVSSWAFIEKDEKLLETLFEVKCFDDISTLIYRMPNTWQFTKFQFETLIEECELDLILFYLRIRDCQTSLNSYDNQVKIVNKYIKYGNRIYYGAEMLNYITRINWHMSLTDDLLRYTENILRTKNILNCHSPIITCLLLCEFINSIADSSVQYKLRCEKVMKELCVFCNSIQEANSEEKYIRFLMTQKDTKGRTAFQISADQNYYTVLKTPEIGTIVEKMWKGRLTYEKILSFSSVAKYLESSSSRSLNPYDNFEIIDRKKTYFHQLSLWMESSSLRYWPESISTIVLILVYNIFIYFLVYRTTKDQDVKLLMIPVHLLDDNFLRYLGLIYILWVASIVLNIPLQYLFGILSGRQFRIDKWGYIEILMFLFAIGLLIDTNNIFPTLNIDGEKVESDGMSDRAFLLRAIILSINDILVWARVTGIFLTFKNLGPLIRMINLLSIKTIKYLVIYGLYLTCMAAVFTAIFYDSSTQFSSFSFTVTNLFKYFINNPDAFNFYDYQIFGAGAVIVFTTFSGLLLSNLLIAVLSNEYEILSEMVDASHRSVLITYYRRYKWDDNYGYLIFLTTPLNIVNFIVMPFSIFFKIRKFNKYVCRIYFSLFYLPIILLIQIVYIFLMVPFAYIKGIFMMITYQYYNFKSNLLGKFIGLLNWLFVGIFYLFSINIRDIFNQILIVFNKIEVISYEKNRIQKYIKKDDIRIFLQFVHSRENDEPNDLHTLFMDYLNFDQEHKAENDLGVKERSAYLRQIKSAAGISITKKLTKSHPVFYSKSKSNKNHSENTSSNISDSYESSSNSHIKRNLIIIEILENFLIDDGSDNFIVDIEKLKMLLPKTMNINNAYIKRILNTDINSLAKAVNKLKNKKNRFVQNKLLNKIVGATIRLDYILENDDNNDPLHLDADRKKHKFELDENEDDFFNELHNLLTKISIDVKNSIESSNKKNNKQKVKSSINNNSKARSEINKLDDKIK